MKSTLVLLTKIEQQCDAIAIFKLVQVEFFREFGLFKITEHW